MHVADKQCSQARAAVQQVEQARLVSTELQAQLLRADQALHGQRQFVMSLQAAAQEAAQGGCHARGMCDAVFRLPCRSLPHRIEVEF